MHKTERGPMTASALRQEGARARLIVERIAGQDPSRYESYAASNQRCQVVAPDDGLDRCLNAAGAELSVESLN
jgi:hypothetical protein